MLFCAASRAPGRPAAFQRWWVSALLATAQVQVMVSSSSGFNKQSPLWAAAWFPASFPKGSPICHFLAPCSHRALTPLLFSEGAGPRWNLQGPFSPHSWGCCGPEVGVGITSIPRPWGNCGVNCVLSPWMGCPLTEPCQRMSRYVAQDGPSPSGSQLFGVHGELCCPMPIIHISK